MSVYFYWTKNVNKLPLLGQNVNNFLLYQNVSNFFVELKYRYVSIKLIY